MGSRGKADVTRSALAIGELDMNAITCEKSQLGFVGVGYMGRPIAQRLLESGFRLSAYDRHRTKAEELIRYGGTR
jgi:phosphoglycerate dehydrogenase-like enzyme